MTKMVHNHYSEEELRGRISRQLRWRESSNTVALIWRGYLAALLDWGLIEVHVFERLSKMLPLLGKIEVAELFQDRRLDD
ncbi:hypothetical protein [Dyella choica]|uniref:Uncharacterized protein n=1 Tax=Dyella choica TaxID=1927959 RepID=A0A3S0Q1X9_9GAMM|nr:hypothetical protein [Dyella choica]RUL69437.1 hypothetical protein EKH80_22440 [Dyella choica]